MNWGPCKELCTLACGFWIRIIIIITTHLASNPHELLSQKGLEERINYSFYRKGKKKKSESISLKFCPVLACRHSASAV